MDNYEKMNNATEKVENIAKTNAAAQTDVFDVDEATEKEFYEEDYLKEAEAQREAAAVEKMREKEKRAELKEDRLNEKSDRSGDGGGKKRKKGGMGGWIAAVSILSAACIVLATLLIVNGDGGAGYGKQLTGTVDETYYDFVNYVDSMDADMSKLLVSKDEKYKQKLLVELSTKARLAADDVARLPLKDESKFYTVKFVNQVGDYGKYLNNKLIDGLSFTKEDNETLADLYKINAGLKKELSKLTADLGVDFDFTELLSEKSNALTDKFDELESNAVDYPKLIYDGPFSDSLDTDGVKSDLGAELTLAQAQDAVRTAFDPYGVIDVKPDGEGEGVIKTYNFDCTLDSGDKLYVELSKAGGKVVLFECYKDCTGDNVGLTEAENISDDFLEHLGFKNMKAVWATESGAVAYLNYVYSINGVIVYPDMVKLTVCKERGLVSGMDAREYYMNHTLRSLPTDIITAPEAIDRVFEDLEVKTCRLAVIPLGETRETLSYEISGKYDGTTYYVYIDAKSGNEVEILKVVETTEGTLLI